KEYGARLGSIVDLVREGLAIPEARYAETIQLVSRSKEWIAEVFQATPVILTPAATGPAPLGLASTGDPRMNAPGTTLGTPAITMPGALWGRWRLGLHLTAGHGGDAGVFLAAVRLEKFLIPGVSKPPSVG